MRTGARCHKGSWSCSTRRERDAAAIEGSIRAVLGSAPQANVDYVAIVDAEDLRPVPTIAGDCLIALALRFGATRLIDNTTVRA